VCLYISPIECVFIYHQSSVSLYITNRVCLSKKCKVLKVTKKQVFRCYWYGFWWSNRYVRPKCV